MDVKPSRKGAFIVRSADGASRPVLPKSSVGVKRIPTDADRRLARAVMRAKMGAWQ